MSSAICGPWHVLGRGTLMRRLILAAALLAPTATHAQQSTQAQVDAAATQAQQIVGGLRNEIAGLRAENDQLRQKVTMLQLEAQIAALKKAADAPKPSDAPKK